MAQICRVFWSIAPNTQKNATMSSSESEGYSPALDRCLLSRLIDGVTALTGSNGRGRRALNDCQNSEHLQEIPVPNRLSFSAPGNAAENLTNNSIAESNAMVSTRRTQVNNENKPEEVIVETVDEESDNDDDEEFSDPPARTLTTNEAAFENGYDSKGKGPPANLTNQEEELLEEQSLGETLEEAADHGGGDEEDDEEDDVVVVLDPAPMIPVNIPPKTLESLKKGDLQEELRIRGVMYPACLKKPELLQRLRESLHLPVTVPRGATRSTGRRSKAGNKVDDMAEFAPGCYWKPLVHEDTAVDEPANELFPEGRAPTVSEDAALEEQSAKHNFKETFDRPGH